MPPRVPGPHYNHDDDHDFNYNHDPAPGVDEHYHSGDTGSRKLGDGDSRSGLLGGDGLDGASPKVSPVVVKLA